MDQTRTNWARERAPDLPTLLRAVRQRPGMWVGGKTIRGLEMMLFGIDFAEQFHNVPAPTRLGGFDFARFEEWIERTYNRERLSLRSYGLSVHLTGSDADGFDLWFRWYDEFQRSGT